MLSVSPFPKPKILDYKEPRTNCIKPLTFLFVLFIIEAVSLTLAWHFNASSTQLIWLGTLGTTGIVIGWSLAVFTQKTLNNLRKRKTLEYTKELPLSPPPSKALPLTQAVFSNKLEAVEKLLQEGANPNEQNEAGVTPLHTALMTHGNTQIALLLLKYGANPNLATNEFSTYPCMTPYQLLFYKGHHSLKHKEEVKKGEFIEYFTETYHWIPLSEENILEDTKVNFCLIQNGTQGWIPFICNHLPITKPLIFNYFHKIKNKEQFQELLEAMHKKGAKFPENPFANLKEYSDQPLSS